MKIYVIDQDSLGTKFVVNTLKKMGHTVAVENYAFGEKARVNPEFDSFFESKIVQNGYDMVFTFNYVPVISTNCRKYNKKYVSWVYDCPQVKLYSNTLQNSCNYVFIFDKVMYFELKNKGIDTVYHMPLAVDTKELDQFHPSREIRMKYQSDVSFVGSLYNEQHCLYQWFDDLPPFVKGYLDAMVQAQSFVDGYFFLEDQLTPELVAEIQKVVSYTPMEDGTETPEYAYAHYFMARKVAEIERCRIIKKISDQYQMKVYTSGDTSAFPNVKNMGLVDYYNAMPYVFKCSKININISLKSIRSGIPLRAFDIMGAGGFLLSNWQAEFEDYFVPGEDLVLYDGENDLLEKIDYYLNHEEERKSIAEHGYQKVKQYHSFEVRLKEMLDIVNGTGGVEE